MINIDNIRDHVVSMLTNGLPETLTYHSVEHTLDVAQQCLTLAKEEGITDPQALAELEIAAIYHDTGFLYTYKGHEEKSCELARKELPGFGLSARSIDNICDIILATKVPQLPKNHLQQIICDADLDYLGREDFFIITEKLHKEFIEYKIVKNEEEWKTSRINFIRSHTFFTKSSRQKRNEQKITLLNYLISLD